MTPGLSEARQAILSKCKYITAVNCL
jgi:hypothetical protein